MCSRVCVHLEEWRGTSISQAHYPLEAIDMEVLLPGVWPLLLQFSGRQKLSCPSSNLAPLFLNFPIIILYVCLYFPPPSPVPPGPSADSLLFLTLSVSPMFSPPVVLLGTTVLSSSSVTAPPHIVCMLYRQPNGGNRRTQMQLDSVCTLHYNKSSFHWCRLS